MTNNNHMPPDDAAQTSGTQQTTEATKKPLDQFVEHQKRAFEETGKALEALLPPGFREHSDTARKEFIKGMKVLVDAAVVELEKAGKEVDKALKRTREGQPPTPTDSSDSDRPSTTGKTKVKVQVE
jgi:hypothetical protein